MTSTTEQTETVPDTHRRLRRWTNRSIRAINAGNAGRNGFFKRCGRGPAIHWRNRKGWVLNRALSRLAELAGNSGGDCPGFLDFVADLIRGGRLL